MQYLKKIDTVSTKALHPKLHLFHHNKMKNQIPLHRFYEEVLKAPMVNPHWSWGAMNSKNIFLNIYENKDPLGEYCVNTKPRESEMWLTNSGLHQVLVMGPKLGTINSPRVLERKKHIVKLRERSYGVLLFDNGDGTYYYDTTHVIRIIAMRDMISLNFKELYEISTQSLEQKISYEEWRHGNYESNMVQYKEWCLYEPQKIKITDLEL